MSQVTDQGAIWLHELHAHLLLRNTRVRFRRRMVNHPIAWPGSSIWELAWRANKVKTKPCHILPIYWEGLNPIFAIEDQAMLGYFRDFFFFPFFSKIFREILLIRKIRNRAIKLTRLCKK